MSITLDQINKTFGSVRVLTDISFDIPTGKITGLVGANGAGKSTLIKILTGYYDQYEGTVLVDGARRNLTLPAHAKQLGIQVVHQEPDTAIVGDLTVADNLLLSELATRGTYPFVRRRWEWERAREVMAKLELDLDLGAYARSLTLAEKQLLLIARALSQDSRYLILDEPTATLGEHEVHYLLALLERLRDQGIGLLFVSHKLREVDRLCDSVVVLRNGRVTGRHDAPFDLDDISQAIVGRALGDQYAGGAGGSSEPRPVALSLRDVHSPPRVNGVTLEARVGEITVVTGLVGAGKSELLSTVYGLQPIRRGEALLDGEPLRGRSPTHALKRGIFLVPEERRRQGLFLDYSARWNVSLPNLASVSSAAGVVRRKDERRLVDAIVARLGVVGDVSEPVSYLSGGNQQKVVVGKWLASRAKLLLLDEPTQGVDIGARKDIYTLLRSLAESQAVVVATSDLEEAMGLGDRIYVLYGGAITATFDRAEATLELLSKAALGGFAPHAAPGSQAGSHGHYA